MQVVHYLDQDGEKIEVGNDADFKAALDGCSNGRIKFFVGEILPAESNILEEEHKEIPDERGSFVEIQIVHKPNSDSNQKYETLDELIEREEASAIKLESQEHKKVGFI